MKKALIVLGLSVLVLLGVLSYDIVNNDAKLLHMVIGEEEQPVLVESTYDPAEYEAAVEEGKRLGQENIDKANAEREAAAFAETVEASTKELDDENTEDEQQETSADLSDADRGYEFYYPQLTEKEQELYRAMYKAFVNIESGNIIPNMSDDEMNHVAMCVKYDHPELFYMKELGYVHYTLGGQIVKTTLSVTYSDSKTVINQKIKQAEDTADRIIAGIPAGADEYTKVKYVYEYLINNIEYDPNSDDNQNIVSALLNGRSVCAGYSRATQYVLNRMGIPTTFVEGRSLISGENHAWNLVKLSDGYYYLDTTWGDASYSGNGFEGTAEIGGINYDYMLITTDELLRTHSINPVVDFPICQSKANNYFVREGLYFEMYDYGALKAAFDRAYDNGSSNVSIKCANPDAYASIRDELIGRNGVFDLLRDSTDTISYVEDEEQRTICFWL